MKVIVTGGAGFIGSNLVNTLIESNYKVTVYDSLITGTLNNIKHPQNVEFVHGDIMDRDKLNSASEGCDVLFHLAASVGNLKSLKNPINDSMVNIIGTLNVLEAVKLNNINKVVYSSSAAIFGDPQYQPIDEEHPTNPDSNYGVSKLAAEKHCLCYGALFDIDIICLRYFNVYGSNQRYDLYGNVIPIFTRLCLDNKPITIFGDGSQTRDFINVIDVVNANILAAEKTGIRGVYNIGSGSAISIDDLAHIIRDIVGYNNSIEYGKRRKGEVLHCTANNKKFKEQLGLKPEIDLMSGINQYINWYSDSV